MLFFFNDTATTEIYTLSLHDALPILLPGLIGVVILGIGLVAVAVLILVSGPMGIAGLGALSIRALVEGWACERCLRSPRSHRARSEEHTSELQSRQYLVCRLLLEKKK